MNIEEIRDHCLTMQAVEECFPFGEEYLVFKVQGKMFLLIPLNEPTLVSMKCDPERAVELRERYRGVEGAFHFNKKYWNQIHLDSDVPSSLTRELIDHSYDEVVKKLPLKLRKEILK